MQVILVIIIVLGNLLLFSGAMGGDLKDNSIAWFLVIASIIIEFVGLIAILSDRSKKADLKEQQSNNKTESNRKERHDLESKNNTSVSAKKDTREPDKIHDGLSKVDRDLLDKIRQRHNVPKVPSLNKIKVDSIVETLKDYQCIEVNVAVNRCFNSKQRTIKELAELKKELDEILNCPNCKSDQERIKYLQCEEQHIREIKSDYTEKYHYLDKQKVILLSKNRDSFLQLKRAFIEILTSQKAISDIGLSLPEFVNIDSPLPDSTFSTDYLSIKLDFTKYQFYLLPDVILVYNKEAFLTAINPVSLIINIQDKQKNISTRSTNHGAWEYSDKIIASDSKLVSQGDERRTWLHTRVDGWPDLRYSYNPEIKYRTDVYSFSEINIQIGGYKYTYSLSKGNIATLVRKNCRDYCSIAHLPNMVPALLRLLNSSAKKKEKVKELSDLYEEISSDIITKEA